MSKGWKKRSSDQMQGGREPNPNDGRKAGRGRDATHPPLAPPSPIDEIEDVSPPPSRMPSPIPAARHGPSLSPSNASRRAAAPGGIGGVAAPSAPSSGGGRTISSMFGPFPPEPLAPAVHDPIEDDEPPSRGARSRGGTSTSSPVGSRTPRGGPRSRRIPRLQFSSSPSLSPRPRNERPPRPRSSSMEELDPIQDADSPSWRSRSPSPIARQPSAHPVFAPVSHASSSSSAPQPGPSAPPMPVSAFAAPSTSAVPSRPPSWEDLNKSRGAAEHRFSRNWSWWSGQPRFAPGSRYKENVEHPIAGDAGKRDLPESDKMRRTRDPARFSIRALSELDARSVGASGAPREHLEFLQRRRGLGDAPAFSSALAGPNGQGGSSRSVALEPLYAGRQYQGVEQQRVDKGKELASGVGQTLVRPRFRRRLAAGF